MSALTQKLGTIKRVVGDRGISGLTGLISEKIPVRALVQRPVDYLRLAPSALSLIARHGRPELLINAIGAGIGDDLLCTAIFHELHKRNLKDFWVTNRYPELYWNNPAVKVVAPPHPRYDKLLKKLGVKTVTPWYTSYNPAYDRDDPIPEQHIISVMCQKAGITGSITLKPYMFLDHDEKADGKVVRRQIAIQSSGLSAKHSMTTKNWFPERYQQVVTALRSSYDFVQLGSASDPLLDGVLDLRGKTKLRETAAVLSRSIVFVGQVGFLMHLARAVDCRSIIVYGGRETPEQSGYSANENLYTKLSCSPCWRLNACPYDRECLRVIDAAQVVSAVERQIAKSGTPLPIDTSTITQEQIDRNALRYAESARVHEAAWNALYR